MTVEEAKSLLQLADVPSQEELEDLYDSKLFDARNQVLWGTAIPSLLRSKIRRLATIGEACEVLLGIESEKASAQSFELNPELGIIDFLRAYEAALVRCRMQVSSADSTSKLCAAIESLAMLAESYLTYIDDHFIDHVKELDATYFDEEVKSNNQLDSGVLIMSLTKLELSGADLANPSQWINLELDGGSEQLRHHVFTEAVRVRNYQSLKKS